MQNKTFNLTILFLVLSYLTNGQGAWTQMASLPDTARIDAMAFAIDSMGYVTQGGDINMNRLHSLWEYNPTDNSWKKMPNFNATVRWQGVSFNIGSKGYFATGQDASSNYNNDLWEYDYNTSLWSQKASMPTGGRNFAVGFAIGNNAYVGIGLGQNPQSPLNDFWEYNSVTNLWVQKANFPANSRAFSVGLSIGTKGYVGAGCDSTGAYYNDFWEYDPSNDSWLQKTNFPGGARAEMDGAHFTLGNFGYMGTGRTVINSSWVYYNDFWKYDPSNDSWTQIPSLPASPRIGASSFTINNIAYIGFGYNGSSTAFSDLWSYDPAGTTTSANELNNKNSIIIFPNPFSTETKVKTNGKFKNATLTIYNTSGQQVTNIKNISGQTIKLYRDNLRTGIYFINVTEAGRTILTDKLIITD